jgi:hypothetical protein
VVLLPSPHRLFSLLHEKSTTATINAAQLQRTSTSFIFGCFSHVLSRIIFRFLYIIYRVHYSCGGSRGAAAIVCNTITRDDNKFKNDLIQITY